MAPFPDPAFVRAAAQVNERPKLRAVVRPHPSVKGSGILFILAADHSERNFAAEIWPRDGGALMGVTTYYFIGHQLPNRGSPVSQRSGWSVVPKVDEEGRKVPLRRPTGVSWFPNLSAAIEDLDAYLTSVDAARRLGGVNA